MHPLDELTHLLRPAGGGIHTVSTGKAAQEALQRRLYGGSDEAAVGASWRRALETVASARVIVLGVPSDTGAGFARGAAFGPQALRLAVLEATPDYVARAQEGGVVDVGDVRVIPQLLSDDMLGAEQLRASRRALYPDLRRGEAARLPVSPLSIAERAADLLLGLNPGASLFVLGGDHSVAWPAVAALARRVQEPWAILHLDAHTDLLEERLGVRMCFATWAYHANELLGRGGRLVQVGIRASGHPRQHWESTLGVKQLWAADVLGHEDAAVTEILERLAATGAKAVYLSNDIDGTDAALGPSTGTPEPGGLSDGFVRRLIRAAGAAFPLLGADLVEVAPPIGSAEDRRRTLAVGASYVLETLAAMAPSLRPLLAVLLAILALVACTPGAGDVAPSAAPSPSAAGVAASPRPVAAPAPAVASALGVGGTVVGRVHVLDGGGPVEVVADGKIPVVTDAAGAFVLTVAPGPLTLEARRAGKTVAATALQVLDRQGADLWVLPAGLGEAADAGHAAPAPPPSSGPGPAALELTLVSPDDKPAAGAWAWLVVQGKGKVFHDEAIADRSGVVRFARLPPGDVLVGADHAVAGFLDGQPIDRAATAPTRARFKLHSASSLQGRVLGPGGKPLVNHPVSLSGELLVVGAGPFVNPTRWQLTDGEGHYRFYGLRRGRLRLAVGWIPALPPTRYSFPRKLNPPNVGTLPKMPSPKRYGHEIIDVSTNPGEHLGGLDLPGPVEAAVAGRVEGAAAGALVQAFFEPRANAPAPSDQALAGAMTDAAGHFALSGLLAGRSYRLVARVPQAAGAPRVVTATGVAAGASEVVVGGKAP